MAKAHSTKALLVFANQLKTDLRITAAKHTDVKKYAELILLERPTNGD
jgi:hypothetical protein